MEIPPRIFRWRHLDFNMAPRANVAGCSGSGDGTAALLPSAVTWRLESGAANALAVVMTRDSTKLWGLRVREASIGWSGYPAGSPCHVCHPSDPMHRML